MHGLGGVFAELFAHRGIGRVTTHHPPNGKEEVVIDAMHQLPEPSGPPAAPAATTSADVPVTDKERILKLFSTNGDQLELIDNRLKAKSGRDYQRRLTYLTLYGHEVHGRTSLPRSDLTTILKSAKVMDSNARAWLAKKVGFTVDGDDRLKLIVGAREEAVTFLNEIADPNVADEWNPDTKTPRTKSKKNP
jgi:hypothetical protein